MRHLTSMSGSKRSISVLALNAGTRERIGVTYKTLPKDVSRGASLLLDDGRIVLWVEQVEGNEIVCRVVVGGELSDSKGINRQGGGLSAKALTDKDRADIKSAVEIDPRDGPTPRSNYLGNL